MRSAAITKSVGLRRRPQSAVRAADRQQQASDGEKQLRVPAGIAFRSAACQWSAAQLKQCARRDGERPAGGDGLSLAWVRCHCRRHSAGHSSVALILAPCRRARCPSAGNHDGGGRAVAGGRDALTGRELSRSDPSCSAAVSRPLPPPRRAAPVFKLARASRCGLRWLPVAAQPPSLRPAANRIGRSASLVPLRGCGCLLRPCCSPSSALEEHLAAVVQPLQVQHAHRRAEWGGVGGGTVATQWEGRRIRGDQPKTKQKQTKTKQTKQRTKKKRREAENRQRRRRERTTRRPQTHTQTGTTAQRGQKRLHWAGRAGAHRVVVAA